MMQSQKNLKNTNNNSGPLLIFFGYRKRALEAAMELGYEVGLFHQNELNEKIRKKLCFLEVIDFLLEPDQLVLEILKRLPELLNGRKIDGVLALSEKSVVVAAQLRAALNLPGLSPEASILGHDKWFMKLKASSEKIPLTPFYLFQKDDCLKEVSTLIEKWGLPIVVKERSLSGGRSMKICYDKESLISHARKNILAEKFIEGTELSVEAFVSEGKVVFRNFTEYYIPRSVNILPAKITEELKKEIIVIHEKILEIFHIERGMTHMEFYLTQSGPLFGELAIRPPGGYIMELLERAYAFKIWKALIHNELGEKVNYPSETELITASWVIHPGAGLVKSVEGLDKIKLIPEVEKIKLKINSGEKIEKRVGAGEDRGSIIFAGKNNNKLISAVEEARLLLKVHWEEKK